MLGYSERWLSDGLPLTLEETVGGLEGLLKWHCRAGFYTAMTCPYLKFSVLFIRDFPGNQV